ncbi:thiolase family protein [Actinoplanes siamensis]|uniref:Acetyl-CoA acetyltransferase n=1 Tax=Actinoplanes siamensis TaxID=1223317 RepID=A0A919N9S3_9ACTN|nr:thiolase family protein [Actinoplanes siamensis]GIF06978.1 acetyl-CoA acetyltransferase [Actinoplanes siamensis]
MELTEAVLIAARRTPVGRAGGTFDGISADRLLAPVIRACLRDARIEPHQVEQVVIGNAAGPGGNIARVGALAAGLPVTVPATSIDQQCSSALEAVNFAARLVQTGAARVVVAGGVESVSTAPWRQTRPRNRLETPRLYTRARFTPEGMADPEMGVAAETLAQRYQVSRERQDEFAAESHRRAVRARQTGTFAAEIVPLTGAETQVATDECPRPGLTVERLARLKPAFVPGGTVTAGNCCPLNDGASTVVVVSAQVARGLGHEYALAFADSGVGAVDPVELGLAAVPACANLLARHPELSLADIEVIEFNEAFAAQTLACLDQLGIDPARVNRDGGAIALGHPYGASGAILTTRIFSQLLRTANPRAGRTGLALMAAAGGVGAATLYRTVRLAASG